MLKLLLTGIGGMVGLMLVWVLVQRLWGKTFAGYFSDEDVLAERRDCRSCGCTTACENKEEINTLPTTGS